MLQNLKSSGYRIVALEQTDRSVLLPRFNFAEKSVLIGLLRHSSDILMFSPVGNERSGVKDELLQLSDDFVEIPVYQKPYSYNVATAAAMAMYEVCSIIMYYILLPVIR